MTVYEENRAYHDQAAGSYDHTMEQDPANRIIRQKVKEKLCSLLPSGRVLDFGGGTGLDLEWLTAQSYEVLFCEPSALMREKAILYNRTILHSDRILFLEEDKTDFSQWHKKLPFPQPCDAVLSDFGALNYIPDLQLLFQNIGKILRPGGHFVLLILKLDFKKKLKWHRRNAWMSVLLKKPFVMYIPYEDDRRQTVFVHSEKEIKRASADWFTWCGQESLEAHDFTLIHLVRNEK